MSTEQTLSYDGPLSTYREWHSLIIGFTAGLLAGWSKTLRRDLRREPHYAIGAFLAGLIAGAIYQHGGTDAP